MIHCVGPTRLGVRRFAGRVLGPIRPPGPADLVTPVAPSTVLNLVPNPAFRATGSRSEIALDGESQVVDLFDQPFDEGGSYVHVHCVAFAADVPGRPGVRGLRVVGTGSDPDTHVAPGGRNEPGRFRLGMRPGRTYTVSVGVALEAPLTGRLHPAALRVLPGYIEGGVVRWAPTRSLPARNEAGDHRISVTFTVPADATAAWVRLLAGMSRGHGSVVWHSLCLTETAYPVEFFDGSTTPTAAHTTQWTGAPDRSPSVRSRRDLASVPRTEVGSAATRLAAAGEVAEARALSAHLLKEPDPAAWVQSARVETAAGDLRAASDRLDRALQEGDPDGDAAELRGRGLQRRRSWAASEPWYRQALAKRPDDPGRGYGLARALDRTGRRGEARAVAAAALAQDRPHPFDAQALLARDEKAFGARLDVGDFLAEHLDLIRAMARDRLATLPPSGLSAPVFVYWAQGVESAPPLVRRCLTVLRATNPDADIHLLSDADVPYYVDLPPDLLRAVGDDRTHRSDLLRLALLERHGGVWLDATCLVTEELAPRVEAVLGSADLFAFNYTGPLLSSWFLAARRGSYEVRLWRAAMWLWWERRGELIDYFLLHHVFELLHDLDDEFRARWAAGTRLSAYPPHALQQVMLEPLDSERLAAITEGSFVHKLRYKYDVTEVRADSYLSHLVRGGQLPLR